MSLFDNDLYHWRETYFVFLNSRNRPSLDAVKAAVGELDEHFQLQGGSAEEDGALESLSIVAPEAYSAMDLSYVQGEEVTEQLEELGPQLARMSEDKDAKEQLKRLAGCDARIDVLHFEQLVEPDIGEDEDELNEMLDPSAILLVLRKLAEITEGIAIDPQATCVI